MTSLIRNVLLAATLTLAIGAVTVWLLRDGDAGPAVGDGAAVDPARDLAAILERADPDAFPPMTEAWRLSLPEDHGAHPRARSETWALTGHLQDETGAPVALSVTITRVGLGRGSDGAAAAWDTGQVHLGQVLLSGENPELRREDDRLSRAAGLAGHDAAARAVRLGDWRLDYGLGAAERDLALRIRVGTVPVTLSLTPAKPAVGPEDAVTAPTRGYVMPRLMADGVIGTGSDAVAVFGPVWLDRLWGEVPLPGGPLARDRMVLHLGDGSELAILRTRRRDGRGIATLEALLVDPEGGVTMLDDTRLRLEPAGGAEAAPGDWRITGAGLDLTATALPGSGPRELLAPIWLGHFAVAGTRDGAPVEGAGTLILMRAEDDA